MLVRTEIGFCALALHAICTQAVTTFGSACFDALNTTHSAGGKATCALGLASVTLNATNLNLILPPLTNQFVVTEIIQEVFQVNSTILENSTKGTNTITGPYDISVVLCYPSDINATSSVKTVQVLAHGLGLDKTYWDIAPGYSYVDAAAEAGYATLAFDRLGVGASDHPDPVNVVQSTTHVEVLHGLIQGLKSGSIGGHRFEKVACVAHSYGSVIQTGHDVKYPRDCDAVIVTGISNTFTYVPSALLSNDPTIANTVSNKFAGLDNGYLITPTAVAFQESFFRYPYFDTASLVFERQLVNAGTYSVGDELTSAAVLAPATAYTGPVDVVLGQYDYVFCMGDCTEEENSAAAFIDAFYPGANANSSSYIMPNSGHNINDHYTAGDAFEQMIQFLKANEL